MKFFAIVVMIMGVAGGVFVYHYDTLVGRANVNMGALQSVGFILCGLIITAGITLYREWK